eukprot:CAMPEP_0185177366 /NCGR_PEP_ID=MMETSP1139-20130426/29618_1 /TAXON_ID=298111 /ORGANISM="Pavlova sp., Strain CCMP459" /LENGTH=52 /DNA_ID=CAMNT_0027743157 /DNA_START=63 /DNA_END=218 /DNA_ORIENTATION=+
MEAVPLQRIPSYDPYSHHTGRGSTVVPKAYGADNVCCGERGRLHRLQGRWAV